jgi:hypothetical protein
MRLLRAMTVPIPRSRFRLARANYSARPAMRQATNPVFLYNEEDTALILIRVESRFNARDKTVEDER